MQDISQLPNFFLTTAPAKYLLTSVRMQAFGNLNIIIGQHERSVHEAIPAYLRCKGNLHFLFFICHHPELNNQSIKPTVRDYLTSSITLLLVVTLTC